MAQPFIPLLPTKASDPTAGGAGRDDRLHVIAAQAATFQPLTTLRPAPLTPGAPAPPTAPATPPPGPAAPAVEVIRDGERIRCIQVRCRCGEVIDLECDS